MHFHYMLLARFCQARAYLKCFYSPPFESKAERRFFMAENSSVAITAAQERIHPALRKLARAYIALAHQLQGADDPSAQSKEAAS